MPGGSRLFGVDVATGAMRSLNDTGPARTTCTLGQALKQTRGMPFLLGVPRRMPAIPNPRDLVEAELRKGQTK
jgi:hypothetical protein